MKVIGIETSGSTGSVGACWDGGKRERPFPEGTSHGRGLAPELKSLLEELRWAFKDIALIAVSLGPGSYTGLRIGTAFAKSLAFATGIPLVGVPGFEAMVRPGPGSEGPMAPVLDARWDQMYAAAFARQGASRSRLTEDLVGSPEEVTARMPAGVLYFGPGAPVFREILEKNGAVAPPGPWDRIHADEVAQTGREIFISRGPDDPDRLHPLYLRPTQAESKKG